MRKKVDWKQRFYAKIKPSDDCWEWTAGKRVGYGAFNLDGSQMGSHRIMMALTLGHPIPAGMSVCHKCDNPSCVRPDHLFVGTHHQNILDAQLKGRMPTKKAHRYKYMDEDKHLAIANCGLTCRAAAAKFGISKSRAWEIMAGK